MNIKYSTVAFIKWLLFLESIIMILFIFIWPFTVSALAAGGFGGFLLIWVLVSLGAMAIATPFILYYNVLDKEDTFIPDEAWVIKQVKFRLNGKYASVKYGPFWFETKCSISNYPEYTQNEKLERFLQYKSDKARELAEMVVK